MLAVSCNQSLPMTVSPLFVSQVTDKMILLTGRDQESPWCWGGGWQPSCHLKGSHRPLIDWDYRQHQSYTLPTYDFF
jgi:hypothetical protein